MMGEYCLLVTHDAAGCGEREYFFDIRIWREEWVVAESRSFTIILVVLDEDLQVRAGYLSLDPTYLCFVRKGERRDMGGGRFYASCLGFGQPPRTRLAPRNGRKRRRGHSGARGGPSERQDRCQPWKIQVPPQEQKGNGWLT